MLHFKYASEESLNSMFLPLMESKKGLMGAEANMGPFFRYNKVFSIHIHSSQKKRLLMKNSITRLWQLNRLFFL